MKTKATEGFREKRAHAHMPKKSAHLAQSCTLCDTLALGQHSEQFLFRTQPTLGIYQSPMAERWPGAIMCVLTRHVREPFELSASEKPQIAADLYDLERAVKQAAHAERLNIVKFGNVCPHLHWHIVPRFEHEYFPDKTPWELTHLSAAQLFKANPSSTKSQSGQSTLATPPASITSQGPLFAAIHAQFNTLRARRTPSYYSAALILRPRELEHCPQFASLTAAALAQAARQNPTAWQCLLMQRNYLDFAWDMFGGCADPGELPSDTLAREIREELGWAYSDSHEITRQWTHRVLRGFVFVITPTEPTWFNDAPCRLPDDEVKAARYFDLVSLLSDKSFDHTLRGRIQAFLAGKPDFEATDIKLA